MAAGAVSLRKSHDIVILSFCNIVKGRAKYHALDWFDSHSALLYWQEKESLYLSRDYSSKLLEPAKRPLASPSSLKRIIRADIRALYLWSVQ